MRKILFAFSIVLTFSINQTCKIEEAVIEEFAEIEKPLEYIEMTAAELEDKIRGGLLAQIIGNLNGLPHEFEYFAEPGAVEEYTPALPQGARTDDDTDLEWVYITEMQKSGEVFTPPERISELWKTHINRSIWCANAYARKMMDLGIDPPLTGRIALNPWSVFNISGQFICESFGLIAPAMPQTASMIGTHFTHVTIDGEPAQATQLFTTMIATAFIESDIDKILDAGLEAVDPASTHYELVNQVRTWHRENPADWRATRLKIKEKYAHFGDRDGKETRDGNGYELNSASTIASLLYGGGDLAQTLRIAFNLGWDADNNAATSATIVGVIKGLAWIESQGWDIKDAYRNTTRDHMPEDETITGFGHRLVEVASTVILTNRGEEITVGGEKGYRIKVQRPANVEPYPEPLDRLPVLIEQLAPEIESGLSGSKQDKARAAYFAICLGQAERLRSERPAEWKQALKALSGYPALVKMMFDAPKHTGEQISVRASAAGLKKPG